MQKGWLIAIGGLPGSGKSTLSLGLREYFSNHADTLWIRTDAIRKELFGIPVEQRLPEEAYSLEWNTYTYNEFYTRMEEGLHLKKFVIADAVFLKDSERLQAESTTAKCSSRFEGFWLDAPANTVKYRIENREKDISDAKPEVVDFLLTIDPGNITWHRLDATQNPNHILKQAMNILSPQI